MRKIGFSTGAIARGDFRTALTRMQEHEIEAVELSALRIDELAPLIEALPSLDLHQFTYVSIHAPSRFPPDLEPWLTAQLGELAANGYPVVVHPDAILQPDLWRPLGGNLLIENMDKRKPIGRTVEELRGFFECLPDARFCFDIGHARQVDPTMIEASLLLAAFRDRLAQVHMSEVNTASRHDPISLNAVLAFNAIAGSIPDEIPVILESLIDQGQSSISFELMRAREALAPVAV